MIFSTRDKVVTIINKYIKGTDESSIAKALLIGYKIDLEKDLVQAYSNAGVVHLIAISGLHMGIIYGVLLWLFSKIPFIKRAKNVRLLLILICLWTFALLTGASPSVLRAAVMFSFIVAGNAFKRNGSVYNSLCASAFLLLCFNPFLLWDVGFQLSYLAVLGIVIAQRSISNWFYVENKLIRYAWELAAVSLSAQLFTFPLCLFYFHQLPLLFLLANIIAIPLATLILWGSLVLVLTSPLEIFALYLGKIINGLLWMLNKTVITINSVPFSLWEGFSVSVFETLMMYVAMGGFVFAALRRNKSAFKFAIGFSLCLALFITSGKWEKYQQKKMIVYNVPAHSATDFVTGNQFYFVGDTNLLSDKMLFNYNLKPSRLSFRANETMSPVNEVSRLSNFYFFYGKRILMLDSAIAYKPMAEKMVIDYLIISKNAAVTIKNLAATFDCKYYIFDATNTLWKIGQWKKECEELHLRFHIVAEQGAFVTDL